MVNVFYDFEIGEAVTPYVGGGIGLVRIDQSDLNYDTGAVVGALSCEGAYLQAAAAAAAQNQQPPPRETVCANLPEIDTPEPSGTDTVFAWQLGAGFGYDITDSVTLQLGYRLQSVDGLTLHRHERRGVDQGRDRPADPLPRGRRPAPLLRGRPQDRPSSGPARQRRRA